MPPAMPPQPEFYNLSPLRAYWVHPGRLAAGAYPGSFYPKEADEKARRFLQAGLVTFIDLTTPEDSLQHYESYLAAAGAALGLPVRRLNFPIPDLGIPSRAEMRLILDAIDQALAAGERVYVHCWGGVGRTGTVIGCHLVRGGLSGAAALQAIPRLRQSMEASDRRRRSPETEAQDGFVLDWQPGW